jgi:hypothetical protein
MEFLHGNREYIIKEGDSLGTSHEMEFPEGANMKASEE